MSKTVKALLCTCALAGGAGTVSAQEQVVNLYSARHYSTDEALYTGFTKATGIKINRVDADEARAIRKDFMGKGRLSGRYIVVTEHSPRLGALARRDRRPIFKRVVKR